MMHAYRSGTAPPQQPQHSSILSNADSPLAVSSTAASPCHGDTEESSWGQIPPFVGSCQLLHAIPL